MIQGYLDGKIEALQFAREAEKIVIADQKISELDFALQLSLGLI